MLRAALRVAARAATIQAEESAAAAATASPSLSNARHGPLARDRRREVDARRASARGVVESVVQDVPGDHGAARADGPEERVKSDAVLRRAGPASAPTGVASAAKREEPAVAPEPKRSEAELPSSDKTDTPTVGPTSRPTSPAPRPQPAPEPEVQQTEPASRIAEPAPPVEPAPRIPSTPAPSTEPNPSPAPAPSQPPTSSDPPSPPPPEPLDAVAQPPADVTDAEEPAPVQLRPSKVPNSRLGRLLHYGSLVAGMSMGAASEVVRRSTGGTASGSVFMSEANVRRLVDKLGRMRGAALKLGQFMSIQDSNMLPEQLERVLQQVQANAHYMPDWQLEDVMTRELGAEWTSLFSSFERIPLAAASIGQVHRATLADDEHTPVAVKVQFPGIAESITSDLDNLSLLLKTSALLPRGLYLDNTLAVMRRELADECDYVKEAAAGRRFREYLADDAFFEVPRVIEEATTPRVLTTEMMSGRPLSQVMDLSQATRDKIGEAVLRLCLKELFVFRFMQTDPNWANFLYDRKRDKLQLIDFGASREYTVNFMDNWYRLLTAALANDRDEMVLQSQRLRYLTGEENETMVDAHVRSMSLLSVPFNTPGTYDFGNQSVTEEVRKLIPTMLKYRLTPPPNETYSLNRKLSGCFLLCTKLGARVDCKTLWEEVVGDYRVTT